MATVVLLAISCHHRLLLLLRLFLLSFCSSLFLLTIEIGCRFQCCYLLLAYGGGRICHRARLKETRLCHCLVIRVLAHAAAHNLLELLPAVDDLVAAGPALALVMKDRLS